MNKVKPPLLEINEYEHVLKDRCYCGGIYGVTRETRTQHKSRWVVQTRFTWCQECGDNIETYKGVK